jgi:hypothetical protein
VVKSGNLLLLHQPKRRFVYRLQFVGQYLVLTAYHKQLHVLKQTVVAPKRVGKIDLVKALISLMPERFNLSVPIDQKCHIKTAVTAAFNAI